MCKYREITTDDDVEYLVENLISKIFSGIKFNKRKLKEFFKNCVVRNEMFGKFRYFFICISDYPIGFVGFYSSAEKANEYWMGWFGILPQYRKKYYGTDALNYILKILNSTNAHSIYAYTYRNAKNSAGAEFLENRGFSKCKNESIYEIYKKGLLKPARNWAGNPFGITD